MEDVLAFLDESGTNPETPVLSVAGFYGSPHQWKEFGRVWRPHADGFHARKRSQKFPELCSAIKVGGINGILCTVSKQKYRDHANEHLKSFVGNPYAICAFMCALEICKQAGGRVSVILEQGQPNLPFVMRILQDMISAGEPSLAKVSSAKKENFVELHPADFVSHLGSSHGVAWIQKLFDLGRLKHAHITEELIRATSPQVTELVRQVKRQRFKAKRRRTTELYS